MNGKGVGVSNGLRKLAGVIALVAVLSPATAAYAADTISLGDVQVIGEVDPAADAFIERGVASAPDGSFWKMDNFHLRMTHFSSTGAAIGSFRMQVQDFGMFFFGYTPSSGSALDVAPDGTLWATGQHGLPIQHYSDTGTLIGSIAEQGSGLGQVGYAAHIDTSSTGHVYVLDWGNGHIEDYTTGGAFVQNLPVGNFAVDSDDTLWINTGCEVEHLNPDGSQISSFGSCGDFDNTADLAVDGTMVYVLRGSVNRIDRYLKDGTFVDSVMSSGSGNGQLVNPASVDVVGGGRIVVSDYDRNDIQLLNADGSFNKMVSHSYTNGSFFLPARVVVSDAGRMYTSDPMNGDVQELNPSGDFVRKIGSRGVGPGQFTTPAGMMIAGDGSLWVSDNQAHHLLRFSATGTYLSTLGTEGLGNGQFKQPTGMDRGADGSFWVADTERSDVQHFAADGTYLGKVGQTGVTGSGSGQLNRPYGVCVDDDGSLWVADTLNDRIRHFSASGASFGGFGEHGTAPGSFDHPVDVACLPGSLLMITDTLNHRVQWLSTEGEPLATWGSYGYEGDNHVALPMGATFANGRAIIADSFNQRLVMLSNDLTAPSIAPEGVWTGGFVSAASGQIPFHIADAGTFVARVVATVDGKRVRFVDGRVDLRRVPEGRRTLRIVVTDGAGNERSWSRRIVVDRTAPYPSALRIVTLRDRASITISDNLSGARSDSRAFGGLRLGLNSRRISLGDLAGNTREVTVRLIYRPSIAQPWNNPRHSVYYMPRSKLFATHVRVGLVKEAQRRLKLLGFLNAHAAVNGRMNGPTTRAMRRFQRQQGLTPSGDLNLVTRFALDLAIIRLG